MLDLRLLTTFRLVARLGTVSAAAEELLISQPALSRQLQQLERELGLSLFARSGRRLELTAAGHQVLAASDAVMSSVDGVRSLAASLAAGRLTNVRAAAPSTTLSDVLAPFLALLEPDDPLITVEDATYAEAIAELAGRIDLAVLTAPPPSHLDTLLVAELPVWAYVARAHHLADAAEISLEVLAGSQMIVLDQSARPRRLLDDAVIAAGLRHAPVIECRNPQVAQALAAAGRGIAVVTDDPRFELVPLPISTPWGRLTITLHAAWDPNHHAAQQLEALAKRLRLFCLHRYGETF